MDDVFSDMFQSTKEIVADVGVVLFGGEFLVAKPANTTIRYLVLEMVACDVVLPDPEFPWVEGFVA
ncbi:hypothetical protein PG989_013051 [Apiospora arundinis]